MALSTPALLLCYIALAAFIIGSVSIAATLDSEQQGYPAIAIKTPWSGAQDAPVTIAGSDYDSMPTPVDQNGTVPQPSRTPRDYSSSVAAL